MGVGEGATTTFSNDVLKLKLSGPSREHLSIVDVPGIFRKTSEGRTTDADMRMVRHMVSGYMQNPRSVMLAVIPANFDIATQEILDMAKKEDPNGMRTLGIFTKPDLVDKGAEESIIEVVEGHREQLALGWHIVRNLAQWQLDDTAVDRDMLEREFFQTKDL